MEKLELAVRNYQRIRPRVQIHLAEIDLPPLKVWLADDVVPVVAGYVGRPSFREQATWVLRALGSGAGTPEQQQIEAVDAALVRCARLLSALVSKRGIWGQLTALYPPRDLVLEETIEIDGESHRLRSRRSGPIDELGIEISQVAAMVNRPWGKLARAEDYFEPQQEFAQLADGTVVQRGELIASLNPELHLVGNFVVRCLFHRIATSYGPLESLQRKLLDAVRKLGHTYRDQEKFAAAWKVLQESLAALRQTLQSGSAHSLRDDCMILTQVYAALHPAPDLAWLDVPKECIEQGAPVLRQKLQGLHNGEVFDRIAAALGGLKQLYLDGSPHQSAIDEAIAAAGLVIDESARKVWWNREVVEANWKSYPKRWEFLIKLAEKALRRAAVQEQDLFEDSGASRSAMAMNASRLQELLPASLQKLIIPGQALRSYRLDLEPLLVRLFNKPA
jgi:hypothetical protein